MKHTHADEFPVIAIGASAGGIEALRALFRALPRALDAAVLVVVHMPAHSPSQLARVLSAATSMPVYAARDRDPLRCGEVVVSTPDHHLMVEDRIVRTTRGPRECRVRPSIDVLFRSVAVTYGSRAVGVVLSGMLDDGTAGAWAIKDRKGRVLVQAPEEAMHPSMPESVIRHVDVDMANTVQALADEITRLSAAPPTVLEKTPSARHEIEIRIAAQENALQIGVMGLGQQSKYTCPDCHGVLVQIEEGPIVRFRCHTGHAFSAMTLLSEISLAVDNGLWATIRALEERQLLLEQLSQLSSARGGSDSHAKFEVHAKRLQGHIRKLREVASGGDF